MISTFVFHKSAHISLTSSEPVFVLFLNVSCLAEKQQPEQESNQRSAAPEENIMKKNMRRCYMNFTEIIFQLCFYRKSIDVKMSNKISVPLYISAP